MWYCRMKILKADRYETVSLKTTDIDVARERAFDLDADIRFRLKHDVPVFNHPFLEPPADALDIAFANWAVLSSPPIYIYSEAALASFADSITSHRMNNMDSHFLSHGCADADIGY